MYLSIEEQRERIREEKRKISQKALIEKQSNKFYIEDYFVKGIYFLYQDEVVVYVGQSKGNVFQRICNHYKDSYKKFDSFTFKKYNVSDDKLLRIERYFIKHYNPKYNIAHNVKRKPKILYRS